MDELNYRLFEAEAKQQGFDQVLERDWTPDTVLEDHRAHPFAASARVARGEMWLTVSGRTPHLLPGDRFEIEAGVPHSERYGRAGAT